MYDSSFPHSNFDSTHDRWSWMKAAQELGKMGAWPITHMLPSHINGTASSLSAECEKVHRCILDELPADYPSNTDSPNILGAQYKITGNAQGLLLSGLSDAAAIAAKAAISITTMASRKRSRKHTVDGRSINDKLHNDNGLKRDDNSQQGASVQSSTTNDIRSNIDAKGETFKMAVNKIIFLQNQQQKMMRNLALAAQKQQERPMDNESPARQRLIEQLRDELIAQQTVLKSHASVLHSGGPVPNLNATLNSLISIDKNARDKGLQLGGPSEMQMAIVQRQKQLMHQQQQQQQQQNQQTQQQQSLDNQSQMPMLTSGTQATTQGSESIASTMPSQATASAQSLQQKKSGAGQAFWNGAILWSVTTPNKERNQAAVFVSGHCAPKTSKDTLMLPWQQKLTISEIQTISIPAIQTFAAQNSTSCVLFQPLAAPQANKSGPNEGNAAPSPQQSNEAMYVMLARMIDTRKACAFIPLQGENCTPEAGLVIIPTPTQAGGNQRRLLGLVFKQNVPWHLFGGKQSTSNGAQQSLQSQTQTLAGAVRPLLPAQQQQPPQHQQISQPFSLQAALKAGQFASPATNLPTSTILGNAQQNLFQPQQQINQANGVLNQQQLPLWVQNAASNQSAPLQTANTGNTPASSATDLMASGGIDFQALANQFRFSTQPAAFQQHNAINPTNSSSFPANSFQPNQGAWDTQLMQPHQAASGQSAPVDLEAIQRLLGLG